LFCPPATYTNVTPHETYELGKMDIRLDKIHVMQHESSIVLNPFPRRYCNF